MNEEKSSSNTKNIISGIFAIGAALTIPILPISGLMLAGSKLISDDKAQLTEL